VLHITAILCDTVLVVSQVEGLNGPVWEGTCRDNLSGKHERVSWTDSQLAAVLALAVDDSQMHHYPVAASAVAGWSPEVRPIP
jgi:hypothetical protein